jgi:preprotein translocase subunit SecG
MNTKNFLKKTGLAMAGLLFSTTLWAHGGAAGTDTDQCKFELEPGHWIHYTAYQPKAYQAEEFCGKLPGLNTTTQLVFDYQDNRYRDMLVEFEVTKEPEGKQVFFLPSAKHKRGSVNLELTNGVSEAGQYLIHITLVPDPANASAGGAKERLDVHMGFKAGTGEALKNSSMMLYVLFAAAGLYFVYLSSAGFKSKVDDIIKSIKS